VSLPPLIASVVQFLRTGYPEGVPEHDYLPLFALLARKLTADEVAQVADELASHGDPTSANAIRRAIADLINEPRSRPTSLGLARGSWLPGGRSQPRNTPTITLEMHTARRPRVHPALRLRRMLLLHRRRYLRRRLTGDICPVS
jgi:uncharacterized protein DUF3349